MTGGRFAPSFFGSVKATSNEIDSRASHKQKRRHAEESKNLGAIHFNLLSTCLAYRCSTTPHVNKIKVPRTKFQVGTAKLA